MTNEDAHKRLKEFLTGETDEIIFKHPTPHPSQPTGFCHCDESFSATLRMTFKGCLLESFLRLPFNRPKLYLLRKMGARIGKDVYISPGVWIDPVYPQLLTVEDSVFIGMFVRIATHEFRKNEFLAGKVRIRQGAFIGGGALIGCGLEIGQEATVAAGCVLGKNVPPGATAIGNPARIIGRKESQE
ncbi:MAG: DapH/DapD/GlmU-related protein [Acidobacteriota bacterium]